MSYGLGTLRCVGSDGMVTGRAAVGDPSNHVQTGAWPARADPAGSRIGPLPSGQRSRVGVKDGKPSNTRADEGGVPVACSRALLGGAWFGRALSAEERQAVVGRGYCAVGGALRLQNCRGCQRNAIHTAFAPGLSSKRS